MTFLLSDERWDVVDELEQEVWDELMDRRSGSKSRQDVKLVVGCEGDRRSPEGYRKSRRVSCRGEVVCAPWAPFKCEGTDGAESDEDEDEDEDDELN